MCCQGGNPGSHQSKTRRFSREVCLCLTAPSVCGAIMIRLQGHMPTSVRSWGWQQTWDSWQQQPPRTVVAPKSSCSRVGFERAAAVIVVVMCLSRRVPQARSHLCVTPAGCSC